MKALRVGRARPVWFTPPKPAWFEIVAFKPLDTACEWCALLVGLLRDGPLIPLCHGCEADAGIVWLKLNWLALTLPLPVYEEIHRFHSSMNASFCAE